MEEGWIDLDAIALRSGEGRVLELEVAPEDPVVGGVPYPIEGGAIPARIDISRTTAGYALRLRAAPVIEGPCARCLGPASRRVMVDAREVEQAGTDDSELSSPYVDDGVLDAAAWLHDAIRLALPEKVLCRPDCAGICPECGVNLNEAGPDHRHETAPDPRFAKLRELQGGD